MVFKNAARCLPGILRNTLKASQAKSTAVSISSLVASTNTVGFGTFLLGSVVLNSTEPSALNCPPIQFLPVIILRYLCFYSPGAPVYVSLRFQSLVKRVPVQRLARAIGVLAHVRCQFPWPLRPV